MTDNEMIRVMWEVTDDMEGLPLHMPQFAECAEYGMTADDVATVIAHLEGVMGERISLEWLPECLMDVCDLALHRPRTLDVVRQEARRQSEAFVYKPFVPRKSFVKRIVSYIFRNLFPKPKNY